MRVPTDQWFATAGAAVINFAGFDDRGSSGKPSSDRRMTGIVREEAGDEYVCIARRNNSLSSSERLVVFGFILLVSLGIAAGFGVIFGAWPILPFAGVEMAV